MGKVQLGVIVTGTTLLPLQELKGKLLRCKCIICENEDIYKENYLLSNAQECRNCAKIKSMKSEDLGRKKELEVLLAQEKAYCNREFRGIRPGEKYVESMESHSEDYALGKRIGDLQIRGYIGLWGRGLAYLKPDKLALNCNTCGFVRFEPMNKTTLGKNFECPVCSKLREQSAKKVQKKLAAHTEKVRTEKENIELKKREEIERLKELEFPKRKSLLDNVKKGSALENHIVKIKDLNKTCRLAGIRKEGSGFITDMVCMKCGTHLSISYTNRNKKVECHGCEELKTNVNYVGYYQKDFKHAVFNRLEIIEQRGQECDVKCTCCGKEQKGLSLYDVVNKNHYCNCPASVIDVVCSNDECAYSMEINIEDIVNENSKKFNCPYCKNQMTQEEIENEMYIEDSRLSTRKKLKAAGGEIGKVVATKNNILKESSPVFAGTDGELYYRCRCTEHNSDLLLTNTEIENYNHVRCNDGRNTLFKNIEFENIKL